jgi:hypothetical protein
MRRNKLGAFFLVSTLALAGIGVSYAGFTDYIQIYGEIDNATVRLNIVDYSCTVIYKLWCLDSTMWEKFIAEAPPGWHIDFDNEVAQYHGFYDYNAADDWGEPPQDIMDAFEAYMDAFNDAYLPDYFVCYEYVSFAKAFPGAGYNLVNMEFNNTFPCKDFIANFIFHYVGSIPAKITDFTITKRAGWMSLADIEYKFYPAWPIFVGGERVGWRIGNPIPAAIMKGLQIHFCDHFLVEVIVHLRQDNRLQGLSGIFTGRIEVTQWYDPPAG